MIVRTNETNNEYKMSDLDQIPNEWEILTLKDVLRIGYGKNQRAVEVEKSEIPILGTGGIIGYAKQPLFDKPSVLIGRKGTIDKPRYIETPFWTIDTLFFTEIDLSIASPKFIYYLFQTIDWYKYNEATGVPSLSANNIYKIVFKNPPLKEQQKIAEILSAADDQIEITKQLIEKSKELKKGLMQQLLMKGIGHVEFQDTDFGQIPKEWSIVQLEEVLKIGYGKNQRNVEVEKSEIPILGTGGIIGWSKEALHDKPSVLIGRKGTIDKPMYMEKPFWTIDTLFYTHISSHIVNPKFIYYLFQTIDWYKYNEATGVPSLSAKNISKIKFACPPLLEQQKIANVLSTVDNQIAVYEKEKEKQNELKKALMQQLLTGEIRVTV